MSFLNKIKAAASVIGIKPAQEINTLKPTTTQEDQRQIEVRKRIQKMFEENHELMATRAMKAHGFDCEDNLTCEREDCYKWVADKIVDKPYVVREIIPNQQMDATDPVFVSNNSYSRRKKIREKKVCNNDCNEKLYNHCLDCINKEI